MITQKTETDDTRQLVDFERVLLLEPFTGLRAIFDALSRDRKALCAAMNETNSYEEMLAKLGYGFTLTKQIHVQDAFTRLAPAGRIKAVLPYYDTSTQSSFPTLINMDATVTTTAGAAEYFNKMLSVFRTQSRSASKN